MTGPPTYGATLTLLADGIWFRGSIDGSVLHFPRRKSFCAALEQQANIAKQEEELLKEILHLQAAELSDLEHRLPLSGIACACD